MTFNTPHILNTQNLETSLSGFNFMQIVTSLRVRLSKFCSSFFFQPILPSPYQIRDTAQVMIALILLRQFSFDCKARRVPFKYSIWNIFHLLFFIFLSFSKFKIFITFFHYFPLLDSELHVNVFAICLHC